MSDLISRQAAIDLLKQMRKDGDMIPWEGKDVFARIRKLPPAQPERIQNNAVHLCDSCQYTYVTCPSHGNDAVFGDGKGNDNICACNKYRPISAQLEQRWIPCSERLPENNCQCIVTAKVKHVDGYPDYEVDTADYTDGIFTTANGWWGIESIIAWMPLPEGYRGEQDGKST